MPHPKNRAFTMVELLSAIAIIAVLTTIAVVFVGNYLKEARKTAARRSVLILNEALNEYRTLGGIANAHSLQGDNSITMNAAVLDSMIAGFTRFGRFMSFAKEHPKFAISALASSGQGQHFHFVLDEVELERWSGGPPPKSNQSTAIALSPLTTSVAVGDTLTFTASGGDGTGEFTWGGEASGTGTSKSVTFASSGTFNVTVYKAEDGDYNQSNEITATITVGNWVSTWFTGNQYSGLIDGNASTARFASIWGLTKVGDNLYVADSSNHCIRRVAADGSVIVFVGPDTSVTSDRGGYVNGTGTAVRMTAPMDIEKDSAGNMYTCSDNRIRKMTTAGVTTTKAYAGGANGLGIDSADNIYVAGGANGIYKITPAGAVSTVASGSPFSYVTDVVYDENTGYLYATDSTRHSVYRVSLEGSITLLAGGNGTNGAQDGTGSGARFDNPRGIIMNPYGDLWVGDANNHVIRNVTTSGVVTTFAGQFDVANFINGALEDVRFRGPIQLYYDEPTSILYVGDNNAFRIRKIRIQ